MARFAAGLRPVIYSVFVKADSPAPAETAEFVREGFNFYAFIFGAFWAGYHRAWALVGLLIALNVALSVAKINGLIAPNHAMLVQLFFQLMLGFEANDFLGITLRKRGYLLADIVCGDTPLRAQLRFLERYFARLNTVGVSAPAASPWSKIFSKPLSK